MEGRSVGNCLIGMKQIAVYVCWGWVVDDGINGVMTYVGGTTRCVWVSEGMGAGDVWKVLEEAVGVGLMGRTVWYNMKYDRSFMLPFVNNGNEPIS